MKKLEFSFSGKVAVITGAAGGLGSSIAQHFGAAGAALFLTDLQSVALKSLSDRLGKDGVKNDYRAIDLTLPGSCQELVNSVMGKMGKIDILVNCAGINRPQKPQDVTEKNWDDIYNINVRSMFFLSQAVGREMLKNNRGKIVNISSQAGLVAMLGRTAYCSSKGAVNQLTRMLALEWAKDGINVNAVAPTFVPTHLTEQIFEDKGFKKYVIDSIPMGKMAAAEDVAYATLFLASDFAGMITGHVLVVDGGWTIQ